MAEDLKAIARRTLEEIIPNGDVAGLRAVMHPEVVNHEPPAGAPPGLDGMIQAMRWVQGGSPSGALRSTRSSPKATPWSSTAPSMDGTPGSSWGWPPPTSRSPCARSTSSASRTARPSSTGRSAMTWGWGANWACFQARVAEPFPEAHSRDR